MSNTPDKADDKPEAVKRLQNYANEKGINLPTQIAITNHFFDYESKLFSELDEYDAEAILDGFDKKGHTYWINKATGQTDITDEPTPSADADTPPAEGTDVAPSENGLDHVLDEESGQVVSISPEKRRIAQNIQQRIEGATVITAILIQLVRDEKLYLAFGCGSFQEYAETMLPFTRQTAYKYIAISEKFAPLLPVDMDSVASMKQLEENLSHDATVEELGSLGMSKLHELTKIPDAEFDEVMSRGVVKMPDGTEWSLDEIKEETSKKVRDQVKSKIKRYKERVSNLEEDKKKYREERDQYKSELEKEQERIERSKDIEEKFGKEAARMEEIDYLLEKTEDGLKQIENSFGKVEVEYSDPEALRERVMTLLRRMTLVQEAALTRYGWLEDMDELSLFPAHKLNEVNADAITDPDNEVSFSKQQAN